MRRLLLVALDWTRPKDPALSLGAASIAAHLAESEVPVTTRSWAVNHPSFNVEQVERYILSHAAPDTDLGVGVFVWNERAVQQLVSSLKSKGFPGRVILGGPQISYVKRDIKAYYPGADLFVRGYGEEALARLMLAPLGAEVEGVTYRDRADTGQVANADFDKLASPFLSGQIQPQRFIRWETQRGCPFRCSFCQHRESDLTMTRRLMPMSRIAQEVDWIVSHPIIQDVAVLDPTFNSGPNYLAVMDALIAGRFSGKLSLQCRAEMVKDPFLDRVEALNQTGHVVLEFGLQTIHKAEWKLIDRPNNLRRITEVLEQTRRRGIETEISLIFGLPQQTVASFKDSIEFCKKMGVSRIYAFPLMLLRGTPLHAHKHLLQLVESDEIDLPGIDRVQDGIPHVVASPSFSFQEWQDMASIAQDLMADYNTRVPKESWERRHSPFRAAASDTLTTAEAGEPFPAVQSMVA